MLSIFGARPKNLLLGERDAVILGHLNVMQAHTEGIIIIPDIVL